MVYCAGKLMEKLRAFCITRRIFLVFYQHPAWFISLYYIVTIVRELWLATERALFSCNDRALWNFFRLDDSFELWGKLRARGRKHQKRWTKFNYIFNNWKKKLAYRYFFRMSDEGSPSARKRMWRVASGVFIVFFLRIVLKRTYNK